MKNTKITVVFAIRRDLNNIASFNITEIRGATSVSSRLQKNLYPGDTVSEGEANEMAYRYNVLTRQAKA